MEEKHQGSRLPDSVFYEEELQIRNETIYSKWSSVKKVKIKNKQIKKAEIFYESEL